MIDAKILRAMETVGCTAAQIVAVVEVMEALESKKVESKREADRIRKRRQRQRERDRAAP